MRKTVYLLSLFILALLVQSSLAQKPPVTRFANVETIFVDRSSFRIIFTSCGREAGGMFIPCSKANKKREAFLDSLERWLDKYGIRVAKDIAAADAVLRGTIHMDDDVEQRRRDHKSGVGRDLPPGEWREEDWTIDAWLENEFGDRLWRSGQRDYPKPGYGWSAIDKIKAKELAKEIEYSKRKAR